MNEIEKRIVKVKKEIEKEKKKVYKKLGTNKCPNKDYENDENWEGWWDGDIDLKQAELKALEFCLF